MVRVAGGADGIDGDFEVAVGAVFKAHGAGKAAGQLAVHLAFGGARADGAPGNQVGIILRRDHVEKFGGGRHAHVVEGEQQAARLAQAEVDVESAVEVRVVDEAFPAHGGARFFEIHAHHNQQFFFVFFAQGQKLAGVFERGFGVVDGAGADNQQQALVAAVHQIGDFLAGLVHQIGGGIADG